MSTKYLYAVALSLAAVSGRAESPNPNSPAPLEVLNLRESHGGAGSGVTFSVNNVSDKAVAAYVLQCRVFDNAGKPAFAVISTAMFQGVIPSIPRQNLGPRQSFSDRVQLPSSPSSGAGKIVITPLYVLYADGTSWGDEQSRAATTIRGLQRGAAMERAMLKEKLRQEGVRQVERDLTEGEQPPPRK